MPCVPSMVRLGGHSLLRTTWKWQSSMCISMLVGSLPAWRRGGDFSGDWMMTADEITAWWLTYHSQLNGKIEKMKNVIKLMFQNTNQHFMTNFQPISLTAPGFTRIAIALWHPALGHWGCLFMPGCVLHNMLIRVSITGTSEDSLCQIE